MSSRRRIDRVTDPELPERVPTLDTAAVRQLRDECRDEEARLSYTRRLLHGRLDIAQAEISRRGADQHGELLENLSAILGDRITGSGTPRALRVYTPPEDEEQRREEDHLLEDDALARLPELDDDELTELISVLAGYEQRISAQRGTVLDHLELLQTELVARYRDGKADIAEILAPRRQE